MRVAYSFDTDNARDGSGIDCKQPLGVPGGLALTLPECRVEAVDGPTRGNVIGRDITIQAVTAVPGSYTLELPATLCVIVLDDPGTDEPENCKTTVATVRVVVTSALSVPDRWQPLGEAVNLDTRSDTAAPALVVDRAGQPLAAWVENGRVAVRRWDGNAWQTLGAGPGGAGAQGRPALALDEDDAPVVAWTEARPGTTSDATQVQVRRWTNGAWHTIGSSPVDAPDATSARDPALLLRQGRLLLAWAEQTTTDESGGRIALVSVLGNALNRVAADRALSAPGNPGQVALAGLDSAELAMAWREGNTQRVQVAALTAESWAPIGSFNGVNAGSLALIHAPGHGLLLAIAPGPPAAQFTVRHYTGSGWDDFGTAHGSTANGARIQQLALGVEAASGAPLLAWGQFTTTSRSIVVRRWSGSQWLALGDPLTPQLRASDSGTPVGVAVAGGSRPYLATQVTNAVPADSVIRVQEFR